MAAKMRFLFFVKNIVNLFENQCFKFVLKFSYLSLLTSHLYPYCIRNVILAK